MKLGLERYVTSKMLLNKTSKDMSFCKWLSKNSNRLNGDKHYDVHVVLQSYSKRQELDVLQREFNNRKLLKSNGKLKEIKQLFGNNGISKFFNYLSVQNADMHSYLDYIHACEYLNLDLTDTKHLTPKDFQYWHDKRIDEMRLQRKLEDEIKRQEQLEQFIRIANKYAPLQTEKNGYATLIAKTPNDLVNEGQALCHCVGGTWYSERFANEQNLIFFVRQQSALEQPYVTVEYSIQQKRILQCYGEHNHKPNDETMNYINKVWLPFANKQTKKIQAAAC